MSDTPKTDAQCTNYFGEWVVVEFARELERKNGSLEREVMEQARLNGMGSEREARLLARVAELEKENAALHHRIARLEIKLDAFQQVFKRLRDCDWVITLPDRMDAVREIARKALEWKEAQP